MTEAPIDIPLTEYLEFARHLARQAGEISLKYFRGRFEVETKHDQSPVTIADRETEQFVRERIIERFPDHGILGEEYGEINAGARMRWIVDPIDGTKSFVKGVPLYTLLLALEIDGEAHVGVIHNPALGETVCGATGLGATCNGMPCRVNRTERLEEAWVMSTDYADLAQARPAFTTELLATARSARTWADAYGYVLVATGRADVMIDAEMNLWDMAALKPIVQEAGGRFTDLEGQNTIHSDSGLAANGVLHEQVLEMAKRGCDSK